MSAGPPADLAADCSHELARLRARFGRDVEVIASAWMSRSDQQYTVRRRRSGAVLGQGPTRLAAVQAALAALAPDPGACRARRTRPKRLYVVVVAAPAPDAGACGTLPVSAAPPRTTGDVS